MSARKAAQKNQSEAPETTSDLMEAKIVAFAEQLGSLVGTVQAKADGWFDRKALGREIGRIRDSAADLFDQVNRLRRPKRKTGASRKTASGKRGRGPVDAPGKRHRKPPQQEPIDERMGEPEGKHMGRKGVKMGRRGVRR